MRKRQRPAKRNPTKNICFKIHLKNCEAALSKKRVFYQSGLHPKRNGNDLCWYWEICVFKSLISCDVICFDKGWGLGSSIARAHCIWKSVQMSLQANKQNNIITPPKGSPAFWELSVCQVQTLGSSVILTRIGWLNETKWFIDIFFSKSNKPLMWRMSSSKGIKQNMFGLQEIFVFVFAECGLYRHCTHCRDKIESIPELGNALLSKSGSW